MLYKGAEFEIGNHWVLVKIIGVYGEDVCYRVVDTEDLDTTQFFDLDYNQLKEEVVAFAMEIKDK